MNTGLREIHIMRFKRQPYYVCLGLLILFGSLIWGGSINPLWAEPFDESQPFNPPDEANPLTPDPTGPGGLLLRIVISLAVIVALSFFYSVYFLSA